MKSNSLVLTLTILFFSFQTLYSQKLRKKIDQEVTELTANFGSIEDSRVTILNQIAFSIYKNHNTNEDFNIVIIDEKNREKSQLAMIWLKTALLAYHIKHINVHSAGVKVESKPMPSIHLLKENGFNVKESQDGNSYAYDIKYGDGVWKIYQKEFTSLNLNKDNTLEIFVENVQIENHSLPKVNLIYSSLNQIPLEMVYIVARLNNLMSTNTKTK